MNVQIGIWTQPGEHAKLYRLGTEIDYYDGKSNPR